MTLNDKIEFVILLFMNPKKGYNMLDQEFLKELNILYVEDDPEVRATLQSTMQKIFKNLYVACDGQEALETYQKLKTQNIRIHAVISDINMPTLNGLGLLEAIRKENALLPFIFTTAYSEVDYLLKAIKLNANDYILKPIDITELIEKVHTACAFLRQRYTIQKQKKELERYLRAIDNVAIISKTDLEGKITFVNKIFCDVAQYSKEELIGKPHNIVRHPDMPASSFQNLWDTIQAGHTWHGKVKNRAKDGSAYYVNASIIPLFDDANETITEYIGIRFLTTDEEIEKREFKKKVLQNIQQSKKKQLEDLNQIKLLQNKLKSYEHVDLIQEALHGERKKTSKLTGQVKHYEGEIKSIQNKHNSFISNANEKVQKATKIAAQLKGENNHLGSEVENLKEESLRNEEIIRELNLRVSDQSKVIADLRDVIAHREDQIDSLNRRL